MLYMLFYLCFVQNRRYREVPSISRHFDFCMHILHIFVILLVYPCLYSDISHFYHSIRDQSFHMFLNSIVIAIDILTISIYFHTYRKVSSLRLVRILLPLRRITRRSAPTLLRTVSRVRRVMSTKFHNLSYPIVPPSSYMSEKRVKSSCMPMVKHHSHRVLCSNIPLYISTKAFS